MAIRCDHCRGSLGPNPQLYWRMKFCSAECVQAYRDRLDEDTKEKIRHLCALAPAQRRGMMDRDGSLLKSA